MRMLVIYVCYLSLASIMFVSTLEQRWRKINHKHVRVRLLGTRFNVAVHRTSCVTWIGVLGFSFRPRKVGENLSNRALFPFDSDLAQNTKRAVTCASYQCDS